jgi:D-beta-D-heptose 7-phosphate kinase/D-beta-D-heptose 1-phosphate adenosyltransferase
MLIARKDAVALGRRLRRRRQKIVFTNGVFDLLHRGHVDYLAKARSYGDLLVVGLNSDKSVRQLKGKSRPLQAQADRAAILLALRAVDYVIIFGEATPDKLIRQLQPGVLVKGADYKLTEIVGADFMKQTGGVVRRVRLTPNRSTSRLIKLIG